MDFHCKSLIIITCEWVFFFHHGVLQISSSGVNAADYFIRISFLSSSRVAPSIERSTRRWNHQAAPKSLVCHGIIIQLMISWSVSRHHGRRCWKHQPGCTKDKPSWLPVTRINRTTSKDESTRDDIINFCMHWRGNKVGKGRCVCLSFTIIYDSKRIRVNYHPLINFLYSQPCILSKYLLTRNT